MIASEKKIDELSKIVDDLAAKLEPVIKKAEFDTRVTYSSYPRERNG